jgi:hypothetical protein
MAIFKLHVKLLIEVCLSLEKSRVFSLLFRIMKVFKIELKGKSAVAVAFEGLIVEFLVKGELPFLIIL